MVQTLPGKNPAAGLVEKPGSEQGITTAAFSRGTASPSVRTLGGQMFSSAGSLVGGDLVSHCNLDGALSIYEKCDRKQVGCLVSVFWCG